MSAVFLRARAKFFLDGGPNSCGYTYIYAFLHEWGRHVGQVRQAKILSPKQEAAALQRFATTRQLVRDQAMFLLSVKTGGRAKEIPELTWAMVTDGSGALVGAMALQNKASKGTDGGWAIPLHPRLREALATLYAAAGVYTTCNSWPGMPVWPRRGAISRAIRTPSGNWSV